MVKTADNRLGWVFDKLVESSGPETSTAPLVNPTGVIVLRGNLTDASGNPVTGVQFAVLQAGVSEEIRTDAMTDADGTFYAFLPADSKGSWWVGVRRHLVRKQRDGCDMQQLDGAARAEGHVRAAAGRGTQPGEIRVAVRTDYRSAAV